jgi:sulfofructose kinase
MAPFDLPEGKGFDVVGFGFNTLDHVCVVARPPGAGTKQELSLYERYPGGQVPTALVALQRWGMRTAYVGPFGDDEGGRLQRSSLEREGVDLGGARTRDRVGSQTSVILVDRVTGERTVLWRRPDGLALRPGEIEAARLTAGRALLMDAADVPAAIEAARAAKEAGVLVVLDVDDPHPRSAELLAMTDVAVVPGRFPRQLTGLPDLRAALRRMRRMGPALVGVTLGAGGALALDGDGFHWASAFTVAATDSTGAGDLFHAGCLYGLLRRWTVDAMLRFAAAAAALQCTAVGGRPAIASLEEVQALAAQRAS